jgi:hypothetical protein
VAKPDADCEYAFPEHIVTRNKEQDFYFGADGLVRRHDYHIHVAGGFAAT